ncbi:coiled-coil domain-containing protein-domain-containing protein [Cladochytrium replicatum]|nr:coiled-coil domain-containing protein-domain-containing protein [Cladochytrium replicatum]
MSVPLVTHLPQVPPFYVLSPNVRFAGGGLKTRHATRYLTILGMTLSKATKVARSRRWRYVQLEKGVPGGYFSEEQIKSRHALLYSEFMEQVDEDGNPAPRHDKPFPSSMNLIERIYHNMDLARFEELREAERQLENEQFEEEEESDEEDEKNEMGEDGADAREENEVDEETERENRLNELVELITRQFIYGMDRDFDYAGLVDENPDYDDEELAAKDTEDAYFDAESDNEDATPRPNTDAGDLDY